MWRIVLLFLMMQTPALRPGEPLVLDLAIDAPTVAFDATAGDVISLSAHSLEDEALDLTLEILQAGQRLAFNDDHGSARSDLAPQDAAIEDLLLDTDGPYQLRVANFNGVATGRVELRLSIQSALANCATGEITLRANTVYRCSLTLEAGQTLRISARDLSGGLDPMLSLLDPDGTILAINDDHAGTDLTLNLLDAQLADPDIPADGVYTLELRDFAGQAGTVALSISS